jgi:hypothetical protein
MVPALLYGLNIWHHWLAETARDDSRRPLFGTRQRDYASAHRGSPPAYLIAGRFQ